MPAGPAPGLTRDELLTLKRDLGDGYARLARGAAAGEGIMLQGGSLGIAGGAFPDLNWGDTWGAGAAQAFRRFVGRLRERGLPGVVTAFSDDEARIAPVARELGLAEPVGTAPVMLCPREDARPSTAGLICRRLDGGDAEAFCRVIEGAFECPLEILRDVAGPAFLASPDVVFFGAQVEGELAAVASTVRVGDTACVYAVGTLPALRRRGAGGAALSAGMEYQLRRGAQRFALQSSESGQPVYERLGFRTVARITLWLVPEA